LKRQLIDLTHVLRRSVEIATLCGLSGMVCYTNLAGRFLHIRDIGCLTKMGSPTAIAIPAFTTKGL